MRFLVIAFLFCLALVGSLAVAMYGLRGSVEKELGERAREVLRSAGFSGVGVEFDHLSGEISGHVDDPDDIPRVLELLAESLPAAVWPAPDSVGLKIRPTLPPWVRVNRTEAADEVIVEGVLGADGESARASLGSRLLAVPGVARLDNRVELDPKVMPFAELPAFVSVAGGLLAHPGDVEVHYTGEAIRMSGTVPNEGIKQGLLEIVAAVEGLRAEEAVRVAVPDSYVRFTELKMTRNRFGVALSGVLPSKDLRDSILAAARGVDGDIALFDRIEIAEDCGPTPWQDRLREIVPAVLDGLEGELTAEFTASQVRVNGRARDQDSEGGLFDRLSRFAEGVALTAEIGAAESLAGFEDSELVAAYEGGLLALSGKMPGEGFGEAVKRALRSALPDISVKDEVVSLPGVAAGAWVEELPNFFAEALARVEMAKFTLSGGALEMDGRTIALPDRQVVQNLAVNAFPASVRIRNALLHRDQAFPKPGLLPEARTRLAESLRAHPVYFEMGSGELGGEAKAKVLAIAALLESAAGREDVLVTGISDNVGNAESNRALSLRRAASVVDELVRLGIAADSLATDARIEDVANLPRSERWKARRVEVSLKESKVPDDDAREPESGARP